MKEYWSVLVSCFLLIRFTLCESTTNLVAYFPISGNANDASGNEIQTITNGASLSADRFGIANSAYSFVSGNYIQVVNHASLEIGIGDFSISVWFKRSAIASGYSGYQRIFTHGLSDCPEKGYYIMLHPDHMIRAGYSCGGTGTQCPVLVSNIICISITQWYHVVLTVERGVIAKLYVNGQIDASYNNPLDCDATNTAAQFRFGSFENMDNQFLGSIDDFRLYSRALSLAEIRPLYIGDPQTSNLIAYLPFGGGITGFSHTTTVVGATMTSNRFNMPNSAFHFIANSYIQIANSADMEIGTGDFTISLWFKRDSLTVNHQRLFSHGTINNVVAGYALFLKPNGDNRAYFHYTCTSGTVVGGLSISTFATTNVWHLLTLTVERGVNAFVYINGQKETTVSLPSACDATNTAVAFLIGSQSTAGVEQFLGDLDDFRFYNRALNSSEVLALYFKDQPTTLMLHLSFTGGVAVDSSVFTHAVTVNGATATSDRSGLPNNAFHFNSGNYISVAHSTLLNMGPGDFTISAWVNPSTLNTHKTIYSHGSYSCLPGYKIMLRNSGLFYFEAICAVTTCAWNTLTSVTPITVPNVWYHYSISIVRGASIKMYINGMLDRSANGFISCDLSSNSVSYVGVTAGNIEPFVGDIDDFRVYNYALSASEIKSLYYYEQPSSQPSRQPTIQPSRQPSIQPRTSPSRQPSGQPSAQPSRQPSVYPSNQPTQQPSGQPSIQPSGQPSRQPTAQPVVVPSAQPTQQPSGQPSIQPSGQPSRQPTAQPVVVPSAQPTQQPSGQPSGQPGTHPTQQPNSQPSNQPVIVPSSQPSRQPMSSPSSWPSKQPSRQPVVWPSSQPNSQPSGKPSICPSMQPTILPSSQPTFSPSSQPTTNPSHQPTTVPTTQPSYQPVSFPSSQPSIQPFCRPSAQPSCRPSCQPSSSPTRQPVVYPTAYPSVQPQSYPSNCPSQQPLTQPSEQPSSSPSTCPSGIPSNQPSTQPIQQPSCIPSTQPAACPSGQPIVMPTGFPSKQPHSSPSIGPSGQPSSQPTSRPSCQSTTTPSLLPSSQPSLVPSRQPTDTPSSVPSMYPSNQPVASPSSQPSCAPSLQPFSRPSMQPSNCPSGVPSRQPSSLPSAIPSCQPTTAINFGTLPNNHSISVLNNDDETLNVKVRIVLPFYFVDVTTSVSLNNVIVNTSAQKGSNYILFGNTATVAEFNILQVAGFIISPAISYDFSGRSVSVLDDVNGDTYPDLIIGVPGVSVCYVLMGTASGLIDMTQGFTIFGAESSDSMGWSVSGAGDVNGDGSNDIIIGAPRVKVGDVSDAGAAYVIYGKKQGFKNIEVKTLQAEDGFAIYGNYVLDYCGLSVSGAGDVNGDGFDDIVIGALRAPDMFRGAVYVVYGNATRDIMTTVHALDSSTGFALRGTVWSWCGYSVSGAGDVNNDTYADIMVGCVPRKGLQSLSEVSYIIYGSTLMSTTLSMNERDLITVAASKLSGGGVFVRGIGDINNDGLPDMMIGSNYGFDSGGGFVIVYPGPIQPPTVAPTMLPTLAPSTFVPSFLPSQLPTAPTGQPSAQPSSPTRVPSISPSQPTSQPSSVPTSPSPAPSLVPSVKPTAPPLIPPSLMPTVEPTIILTNTQTLNPTQLPTRVKTVQPTHSQQSRPSIQPSVQSTVADVTRVSIARQGVFLRNFTNTVYYVNATGNVTIVIDKQSYGSALYIVYPNAHSLLTIHYFNVSSDTFDLSAFASVRSVIDLLFLFKDEEILPDLMRRQLAQETARGILRIDVGQKQSILLFNMSASDIADIRFIFASINSAHQDDTGRTVGHLIVLCTVFGVVLLWLVYHIGLWYVQFRRRNKNCITNWTDEEQSNPTFVTFDPNCSYKSEESDSDTDYSSIDLSTEDYSDTLSERSDRSECSRHSEDISLNTTGHKSQDSTDPNLDHFHGSVCESNENSESIDTICKGLACNELVRSQRDEESMCSSEMSAFSFTGSAFSNVDSHV